MVSKDNLLLVDNPSRRLGSNEAYSSPLEVGYPSDSLGDEEHCSQSPEPLHMDQPQR